MRRKSTEEREHWRNITIGHRTRAALAGYIGFGDITVATLAIAEDYESNDGKTPVTPMAITHLGRWAGRPNDPDVG